MNGRALIYERNDSSVIIITSNAYYGLSAIGFDINQQVQGGRWRRIKDATAGCQIKLRRSNPTSTYLGTVWLTVNGLFGFCTAKTFNSG
jgi:hypothetical protein